MEDGWMGMGLTERWQNGMKQLWNTKMLRRCTLFLKVMVSTLAVQGGVLTLLEWGYPVDLPVVKWFFTIFQKMDGWGMGALFFLTGIVCIFYIVRNHPLQKNRALSVLCAFFAVCTLFGKSYYDLGQWSYIFHGRLQFGLACFVGAGYYWLYKNAVILCKFACDKWNLGRRQTCRE